MVKIGKNDNFDININSNININKKVNNSQIVDKSISFSNNKINDVSKTKGASTGAVPGTVIGSVSAESTNLIEKINDFSGNKADLDMIVNALNKLSNTNDITNFTGDDMLAFSLLGLDVLEESEGVLMILDESGKSLDLSELRSSLPSVIDSANRISKNAPVVTNSKPKLTEAEIAGIQADLNTMEVGFKNAFSAAEKSDDSAIAAENAFVEFQKLSETVEQNDNKINNKVGEIINIQKTIEGTIERVSAKESPSIADIQALKRLNESLTVKQGELVEIQSDSEQMVKQADLLFATYSEGLNSGQLETATTLNDAMKLKVSGSALSVNEYAVANYAEQIYDLTAGMSLEEIKSDETKKMLEANFKGSHTTLDKISRGSDLSDLTNKDINNLKELNIEVEQGKLIYTNKDGEKSEVSRQDIEKIRRDLNNLIQNDNIRVMAHGAGKVISLFDPPAINSESTKKEVEDYIASHALFVEEEESSQSLPAESNTEKTSLNLGFVDDDVFSGAENDNIATSFVNQASEKINEETKRTDQYAKQLADNRKQINKSLEQQRFNQQQNSRLK